MTDELAQFIEEFRGRHIIAGTAPEAIQYLISMAVQCVEGAANTARDSCNPDQALALLRSAQCLQDTWQLRLSLSKLLNGMHRYDEADEERRQAFALAGEHPPFSLYFQAGVVAANLGRFGESVEMYRRSMEVAGREDAQARFNLSLSLLAAGQFEDGWREYEQRFIAHPSLGAKLQSWNRPRWEGERLNGRTLCVFSDQGHGDYIMFARFLPFLKELGGTVVTEVQSGLAPLIQGNAGSLCLDHVATDDLDLAPLTCDCVVPICSLPRFFANVPRDPYIRVTKEHRLEGAQRKIGLCWAGAPTHRGDERRSIPLRLFQPVFESFQGQIYGLEMSRRPSLLQGAEQLPIRHLEITDFTDTAAWMTEMELVITVDTAVAHLAGAMGIPVWVLIPFAHDFRWSPSWLNRPWYPSMQVFRQPAPGAWNSVIDQVARDLHRTEPSG